MANKLAYYVTAKTTAVKGFCSTGPRLIETNDISSQQIGYERINEIRRIKNVSVRARRHDRRRDIRHNDTRHVNKKSDSERSFL
jgi:hypothetical protein